MPWYGQVVGSVAYVAYVAYVAHLRGERRWAVPLLLRALGDRHGVTLGVQLGFRSADTGRWPAARSRIPPTGSAPHGPRSLQCFLLRQRSPPSAARGITFGPAGRLAHLLGAGLRCDLTTAAATGLLDARTRDWSPAVAHAAGIDTSLLPRLITAAALERGHHLSSRIGFS